MKKCRLQKSIEEPWTTLEPIALGDIPSGRGTPDYYCLITDEEHPRMRIDIYGRGPFTDAEIWQSWVIVGLGDAVHFISLETHIVSSYPLGSYFGHLYSTDDYLLVASATSLFCFDTTGKLQWVTQDLGLDGVLVEKIENGYIYGEGEWDPPGGWLPFTLLLHSGLRVQE